MCDCFNIGDKVEVLPEFWNISPSLPLSVTKDMKEQVGRIFTVKEYSPVTRYWFRVKEYKWMWDANWFTLYNDKEINIKVSDWNKVLKEL